MTAKQAAVKKYVVKLSNEERERLNALIHTGKHRAGQLVKARILLKADASDAGEGWSDSEIAAALDTSVNTVARTRQQLVEEGFESVLTRKHSPASARQRIFDGETEAKLIALACSDPPQRRVRWTLRLLEPAVVELNIVDRASDNTILGSSPRTRTLKKTFSSLTFRSNGSSRQTPTPPSAFAGACFVAGMEDVLEVYQRPHDPECPVVCLDEASKQLVAETRVPIPAKPGHPARHDYEYGRKGTANLFMMFAPLEGWRHVESLPLRRRG